MTDQTSTQTTESDNSTSGDTTTEQTNATQQTTQADATTTTNASDSTNTTEQAKAWHEDDAIKDFATKRGTVDGKVDQKLVDKTLSRLKRFPTLGEALNWAFESDKKIADGTWKKDAGKAPETPEELATYRELNGIPEAPEGYLDNLPDGLVIGEEDRPIIDHFLKAFHGKNASPEIVQDAIKAYYSMVDEAEGARQIANVAAKEAAETTLKAELGPQYKATINMIDALVGTMPEELRDELYQSTKPDGSQIMNNPAMLKWLAEQAKAQNFTGTTLPTGQQSAKTLTDEIGQIEAAMKDTGSEYYRGPKTPGGETVMRARYRELLDKQMALTKK